MLQKRKKIVSVAPHRAPQCSFSPCDGTVDYADVPVIDFAGVQTPEGRLELAPKVRDAMRDYGFMCIVNHGLSQAQVSGNKLVQFLDRRILTYSRMTA